MPAVHLIFPGGHGTARTRTIDHFVRVDDLASLAEDPEIARQLHGGHGQAIGLDVHELADTDVEHLQAFADHHQVVVVAREGLAE